MNDVLTNFTWVMPLLFLWTVSGYRSFGETLPKSCKCRQTFLRNVGVCLQVHTALQEQQRHLYLCENLRFYLRGLNVAISFTQTQHVMKSTVFFDVFHSDFLKHKLVSLRTKVILVKLKVIELNSLPSLE